MNVIVRTELTEAEAWEALDTLSDEQIGAFARLYPPRCILATETLDDHQRYAGKVELVEMLVKRRAANPRPIRVDASDPNSIEGLARTDVPAVPAEPAPAAAGPAASARASHPAASSATARATEARSRQTQRRGGKGPGARR